jgi:hypothetical protein
MNEEMKPLAEHTDQEIKDKINLYWKNRDDYILGPGIYMLLEILKERRDARKKSTERMNR